MPEQYATRLKVGVVTPSTNTTLEPDCHALCPPGVTVHTARIPIQNRKISGDAAYAEHVKAMREGIGAAIAQVMTAAPDHLVMGVALEAFWGGVPGSTRLQQELESLAGVPVSMGSTAMHNALQRLGAKRISVLTPHMPAGDEQVRAWFEEAGYEIAGFIGLQCASPRAIAEVSANAMQNAISELDQRGVDAIVQVGTNLQFRPFAGTGGTPILALNTVMMWDSLRRHKITDNVAGAGIMLEQH